MCDKRFLHLDCMFLQVTKQHPVKGEYFALAGKPEIARLEIEKKKKLPVQQQALATKINKYTLITVTQEPVKNHSKQENKELYLHENLCVFIRWETML